MKRMILPLFFLFAAGCSTVTEVGPEQKTAVSSEPSRKPFPVIPSLIPFRKSTPLEQTEWELDPAGSGLRADQTGIPDATLIQLRDGIYLVHGDRTVLCGHYARDTENRICFMKGVSARENEKTAEFFRFFRDCLEKADSFHINDKGMTVNQGKTVLLRFRKKETRP